MAMSTLENYFKEFRGCTVEGNTQENVDKFLLQTLIQIVRSQIMMEQNGLQMFGKVKF
jgi:hypothetical protein